MSRVHIRPGDFPVFQFLLFILMILSGKSSSTDTITQSQGISVGQNLISSGEMFELGFFSPSNTNKQYAGIWYRNISDHKIVWVANRNNPISVLDSSSSLSIGKDGNLILLDGVNNTIWSTNISISSNKSIAVLSDKGDFSLFDSVSGSSLWDSFSNPGDTFVAGMSIGADDRTGERISLSSWRTESDPFVGTFVGGLTTETPPQAFIRKSTNPYWRSGPWDGWRFTGIPNTGVGYSNGLMVTQDNQRGSVYLTYNPPTLSRITLMYVTPEGILEMSHWDISSGTQEGATWQSIKVPCDVYGTCGSFGVCDRNGSRTCECLKGFVPKSIDEWKIGNWTNGCVRRAELQCENDGFLKLSSMKLPDHYTYMYSVDISGCERWCLGNCSCRAYAFPPGIGCLVWTGDLIDTVHFSSTGEDVFLRVAHSELEQEKKSRKLIISLTTVSGVILLGAVLFALCWWKACRKGKEPALSFEEPKKLIDCEGNRVGSPREQLLSVHTKQAESSDLPNFDFDTLIAATNNFGETNKLGGGGFGPVYKGNLKDGREIAVKRLSSLSGQGAEEFKNEILLISKLQHRNLVRLLGYCIKGDEKLLIYEYLKNKSLDNFIFESKAPLDWDKRLNIILGIARGLLYLHRDSRLRIIHRDLKASNILLDDNMDPKISDFGLARVFQITQELANTHRVVGTFGYMSPEYAMGGQFSEKSDVFSFGILLLEIISGKRNTSFYNEEKYNLLGYAWNLWKEGRPLELMDEALNISCPDAEFVQCMHIGLLCVQDHAVDRPNMSDIALMLTSETDLPLPKPPTFYQTFLGLEIRPQSSSSVSINNVSVSVVDAR